MVDLTLRVASPDGFFDGTAQAAIRIDAGDLRVQPSVVAFESMELFLKTITANRWRLLQALKADGAASVRRLSQRLARDYRGVHADVAALVAAGLIERDAAGKIFVPWDRLTAEMVLGAAA